MYEGPIKAVDRAAGEEAPILRQLRWTDLVARIAATRDQRATPGGAPDDAQASFASFHLAGGSEGQRSVNRDALSRGKFGALSMPDAANNAGNGDRETR
jgi:hypothetical protein